MPNPTWIFISGTYRTGSTTQYRITRDIVEETGNGIGLGYHQEKKLVEHDIPQPGKGYVVCKVFIFLPETSAHGAQFLREERLKSICTIRDPRDIITSMRERHKRQMEDPRHQAKPFNFHERVCVEFPKWLGDLEKWVDLGDLNLMSRFEEMTADIPGEVKRIANFLDIELSDELVAEIASRHEKDAIQAYKKKMKERKQREDPWLPSIPGILFGKSGSHKEHLTDEEISFVEECNRDWMERFEYL